MAEERKILKLGDRDVPVTQLDILKRSGEGVAEYLLEDESVIRVSNVATIVYRMEDTFDTDGSPLYLIKLGTSVTTVKSSPKLNNSAREYSGKPRP